MRSVFARSASSGASRLLVVLVVGDEVPLYLVVGEQASCTPGVLAGYEVGLAQVAEGAEGDVLQVAYGGWDHCEGHLSAAEEVLSGRCVPGERRGAEDAGPGPEGSDLDVGQVAGRGPGAEDDFLAGRL